MYMNTATITIKSWTENKTGKRAITQADFYKLTSTRTFTLMPDEIKAVLRLRARRERASK